MSNADDKLARLTHGLFRLIEEYEAADRAAAVAGGTVSLRPQSAAAALRICLADIGPLA